jgi:hypothetical protein
VVIPYATLNLIFTWDRSFNLRRADLSNVDLRSFSFPCADLEFANLAGADLRRISLHRANLRGANLEGARLDNAILLDAQLKGAEMAGATLTNTDLRSARMEQTSGLTQEQLNQACQSVPQGIVDHLLGLENLLSSCERRAFLPDVILSQELTAPSAICK